MKKTLMVALCLPALALAQAQPNPIELDAVSIQKTRPTPSTLGTPEDTTTVETITAEQARELNFINTEDAIRNAPNLTLRKRYIGDRNSLVGGRSSAPIQAARTVVYADGFLLSQFLGNFNAPRWNMVSPEELDRVEVLYGPYSAIYPGNSIGQVIVMSTELPKRFTATARQQAFTQSFDDAGFKGTYGGFQSSVFVGDKVGRWKWSLAANDLQVKGQPMQYLTLQTPTNMTGTATPVTGAVASRDPQGRPWFLAGPNGSAIEDNHQRQLKLRAQYALDSRVQANLLASYWENEGLRSGQSLLKDANGNTVWSGLVSIDGQRFNVPVTSFSPQEVRERHTMIGASIKSDWLRREWAGWNGTLVFTRYAIDQDQTRTSTTAPPSANVGGRGMLADNGGTGWMTFDGQATYEGDQQDWVLGLHQNAYNLESRSFALANDWRSENGQTPASSFFGKTRTTAVYAQNTWRFADDFNLTSGLRAEQWEAYDGSRQNGAASAPYAARREQDVSPKVAISYLGFDNSRLRLSYGRAVRYPTVSELFQGTVSPTNVLNNDPNLQAERSDALELSWNQDFAQGDLRVSLFHDRIQDTLFSQTNVTVFPNVTNIQNIGLVETSGVEISGQWRMHPHWQLRGNAAYNRSEIKENQQNPALVGKRWVRIPETRSNLVLVWQPSDFLSWSQEIRQSGRQFINLDNSDSNPNSFGGISSFVVFDSKLNLNIRKNITLGLGVDNLFDERYYQFHPFPGRTFLAELRVGWE
jgi:iron complex outermembrane receptor protein